MMSQEPLKTRLIGNVASKLSVTVPDRPLGNHLIAAIVVAWLLFTTIVLPGASWGNGADLTEAEAISIATKELRKMGYRTKGYRAHIDDNNAGWKNYVEMRKQRTSPEAVKEMEGIESVLAGRSFMNVIYSVKTKPNQAVFGGISVFLDSKTGEVLIVMTHRETIIKPLGKK